MWRMFTEVMGETLATQLWGGLEFLGTIVLVCTVSAIIVMVINRKEV